MKREYYNIYEMLYAEYVYENDFKRRRPFSFDEYYIVKIIRKSIDTNDKENLLRPDAKYFLLVNFHHLIVRPLFERRPYGELRFEQEFQEIEFDMESDINFIISETKRDLDKKEISGHQIMRTIDRIWNELKTTRLEIWG